MRVRVIDKTLARISGLKVVPLCGAVVAAAVYGPTVKASRLEAARAQVERAAAAAAQDSSPGGSRSERDPGADPTLCVCTHADWDRAAGVCLSIKLHPLPPWEGHDSSLTARDQVHHVGIAWRAQTGLPTPVRVDPNTRAHAPPARVLGTWA